MTLNRLFVILVLLAVVLSAPAYAKRGPKPKVDPVEHEGIRYTAHGDNWHQCVQALEIKTGKVLWDVTVFHNIIIPLMEEDVQWVFIKRMYIDENKLIVVAEDGQAYGVDLKTGAVKKLKKAPPEKKQAEEWRGLDTACVLFR